MALCGRGQPLRYVVVERTLHSKAWQCSACLGIASQPCVHASPKCGALLCTPPNVAASAPGEDVVSQCGACGEREARLRIIPAHTIESVNICCLLCGSEMPRRAWEDHIEKCTEHRQCVRCKDHMSDLGSETCLASVVLELKQQLDEARALIDRGEQRATDLRSELSELKELVRSQSRGAPPASPDASPVDSDASSTEKNHADVIPEKLSSPPQFEPREDVDSSEPSAPAASDEAEEETEEVERVREEAVRCRKCSETFFMSQIDTSECTFHPGEVRKSLTRDRVKTVLLTHCSIRRIRTY